MRVSGHYFEYPDRMPVEGEPNQPFSDPDPPADTDQGSPAQSERVLAVLEVLICSDYPTQLALGTTFAALGFGPTSGGTLSLTFVVLVSLADSLLLLALIAMLTRLRGESLRDLLFGDRSIASEARAGVRLALAALAFGVAILVTIQLVAPSLHDVATNPLQTLIRTPRDAAAFAVVVVLAGGLREEVQRAFLLRRFERWLGGGGVGVVVTSLLFGAGHRIQGLDAAVATGLLGAFWGLVYLRRRSVVAPVVSHAGFNLLQLAQFLMLAR
jgi:membrane protease YdiL (CAAX protease family)